MPLYLGNKLVSGQSRPIDANPIEGSENLISSGGVKTYVDEKIAGHVSDATIHVTEEEKAAWNGKQPKITANGLLKGDGNGGVSAAAAGTDYAAASHNHDSSYLKLSGGKLTGNLQGKYITGTWLQTTESTALGSAATKICVLDGSGWVYYRTPEQIQSDIGVPAAIQAAIGNAIGGSY